MDVFHVDIQLRGWKKNILFVNACTFIPSNYYCDVNTDCEIQFLGAMFFPLFIHLVINVPSNIFVICVRHDPTKKTFSTLFAQPLTFPSLLT